MEDNSKSWLPTGTLLNSGKYEISDKIGNGAFAITYKAKVLKKANTYDAPVVAIKEFFSRKYSKRSGLKVVATSAPESNVLKSFLKHEGDVLNKIKNNSAIAGQNLVKVIDSFEENGTFYIVLEYIDGQDLDSLVKRNASNQITMPVEQVTELYTTLLKALGELHAAKICHLDISPKNIILRNNTNSPVLIDFGAACFFRTDNKMDADIYSDTDLFDQITIFKTTNYCTYEQATGQVKYGNIDFANNNAPTIDLYSLAASMYYCLMGQQPKTAEEYKTERDATKSDKVKVFPNGIKRTKLHEAIEAVMQVEVDKRTPSVLSTLNILGISKYKKTEKVRQVQDETDVLINSNQLKSLITKRAILGATAVFFIGILIGVFAAGKYLKGHDPNKTQGNHLPYVHNKKMSGPGGDTAMLYTGQIKDDKPTGLGKGLFSNGDIVVCNWENGEIKDSLSFYHFNADNTVYFGNIDSAGFQNPGEIYHSVKDSATWIQRIEKKFNDTTL